MKSTLRLDGYLLTLWPDETLTPRTLRACVVWHVIPGYLELGCQMTGVVGTARDLCKDQWPYHVPRSEVGENRENEKSGGSP